MCRVVQSLQLLVEVHQVKTVTFTEFRQKASSILDLVEEGETVRILRHGKTIAKIIPAGLHDAKPAWKRSGLRLIVPGALLTKAVLEERQSSP